MDDDTEATPPIAAGAAETGADTDSYPKGHPADATTTSKEINLVEEFDNLDFHIEKSIRYHHRRRAFYEWWHRLSMFAVIIGGSATIADILPDHRLYISAIPLLAGTLDLVIGFSNKVRDHQDLARRFTMIAGDMLVLDKKDLEKIVNLKRKIKLVEADEPSMYYALEADCYNEVCRALGLIKDADDLRYIPWWQLRTKNYFRYEGSAFLPKNWAKNVGK